MTITELWDEIASFEDGEQKNDSTNSLLANARQGARVEAYAKLQDQYLNKIEKDKRFICLCGLRFTFNDLLEHQRKCMVLT